MREIKFKLWDSSEKKMLYPKDLAYADTYLKFDGKVIFYNVADECGHVDTWETDLDEMIPLQYTGVIDKNYKNSCHKDIVNMGGFLFTIEWDDRVAKFYLKAVNKLDTRKYSMKHLTKYGEIIGSVYENPELIKE